MDIVDFALIAVAVLVVGINVIVVRNGEKDARRKLGPEIVEIPLYHRWSRSFQWILLGFSILLPAATIIVGVKEGIPAGEVFSQIVRTLWFIPIIYTARNAGVLMIGSKGLAIGPRRQFLWDRIDTIVWDNDIGQKLWGFTLSTWDARRKYRTKSRFYVPREVKEQVVRQIELVRADTAVAERAHTASSSQSPASV